MGLAHVVHASHIAELDALGTFAYAAPELINGDKCNEKADIWCSSWLAHILCLRPSLLSVRLAAFCAKVRGSSSVL